MRTWIETTDQMGERLLLAAPPRRIVSLVPSQTELLFDLGLDEEVVGVTDFCTEPARQLRNRPRVGGTKNFHVERIRALQPDLVIGNKEENEATRIAALRRACPVWLSDIITLDDARQMIAGVARLVDRDAAGQALLAAIDAAFLRLPAAPVARVAYLIWRKPYMVAGHGCFIDAMLRRAGLENVFADLPRYPEVSPRQLAEADPDVVLLSSEPYPFQARHHAEFQALLPAARIVGIDGRLCSWYGSRLRTIPALLQVLVSQLRTMD